VKLRKILPAVLAGALLLAFGADARAEIGTPIPPAPTRWLTDTAAFLSPAVADELNNRLEAYERSSGRQVVVYIGVTTGDVPIDDWAVKAFEAWRVGRKGLDDGLALFIMAQDRSVRIEVGYGLEGVVPDITASRVINDEIVPRLQKGDNDGAVTAAVERLTGVISGESADNGQGTTAPKAAAKLTWMQKIIIALAILGFLILLVTNPSLAIYLLFSLLSGGRGGGGGGGGGFSGGGGRSGGGGASGSW
jgi:uncharacterized protein